MKQAVLILLAGVLVGCVATSSLDAVVLQIKPGMSEGEVREVLKPYTLDTGTVYWGGTGAKRLHFQISKTEQIWIEMAGGPNGRATEIGQPGPKKEWIKHSGDSITMKEGPTTPRTVP